MFVVELCLSNVIAMRFWDSPSQDLPYSFEEVASIFWNRYPNSKAQHVISEDVLERKVMFILVLFEEQPSTAT